MGKYDLPRSSAGRRRLGIVLSLVVGLAILVGGIVVSLTRDVAVQWGALVSIVGFTVMLFAAFLWVRFSK